MNSFQSHILLNIWEIGALECCAFDMKLAAVVDVNSFSTARRDALIRANSYGYFRAGTVTLDLLLLRLAVVTY